VTTPNEARSPLHPFGLHIDPLERMLNFEISDDPHYSGLEIQWFDDPRHGRGILVFLNRRTDGKTDVYFERALRLNPTNYAVGNGLGEWVETEFATARLEVDDYTVRADVQLTDTAGRSVEVHVGDRTPRGRRYAAFLAPMGAAVAEPTSLPLIWMSRFDLMRRSGPKPVVLIDGRHARLGRLPAEALTGRRLIKVTSDLCAVHVCRARPDPTPLADDGEATQDGTATKSVVERSGGHEVRLELDPPFPDLNADPVSASGAWSISIDRVCVINGTWHMRPGDRETQVDLEVTEGWRPKGLPLLMSIVTRVAPVFRTWPTTYRWTGRIAHGEVPTMTSNWSRTDDEHGESYRALTGSS
jgi:hypothetical protein